MLPAKLPPALTLTVWDKQESLVPKPKAPAAAGVGEALKALKRLHDETDLPCFDLDAAQSVTDAEKAVAQLAGEAAKRCKAVADHAKVVKAAASKLEAAIKNDKDVPKTVLQATLAVGKTVGDYVAEVLDVLKDSQAELGKRIEQLRSATPAKASDKDRLASPEYKLVRGKVLAGLRTVKKAVPDAPPVKFVVATGPKYCMAYLAPSVGASHKTLLADLMPGDTGIKYCIGEVIWERKAFTFVSETAPSGLVKRLQAGLFELTGSKLRVRVRKPTGEGEEVEGDEDFADADAQTDEQPKASGGSGGESQVAKIAALSNRHARIKTALAAIVAKGGTLQAELVPKLLDKFKAALEDRNLGEAAKILEALEATAAKAPPQQPTIEPVMSADSSAPRTAQPTVKPKAEKPPLSVEVAKAVKEVNDKRLASEGERDKIKRAIDGLIPADAAPSAEDLVKLRKLIGDEFERAAALDAELKQAADAKLPIDPPPARVGFDDNEAAGASAWTEPICAAAFAKYGWFEFKDLRKSKTPVDLPSLATQRVVTDDVMWKLYQYRRKWVDATIKTLHGQFEKLFFVSSGSEDIESDLDITVASPRSGDDVKAMRAFNAACKARFGRPPGRVFDTNLYARDYKAIKEDNLSAAEDKPGPDVVDHDIDEPVGEMVKMSDIDQDVATLMKQRRFLDAETFQAMWQALRDTMPDDDSKKRIQQRFEEAEDVYLLTALEKVEGIVKKVKASMARATAQDAARKKRFAKALEVYETAKRSDSPHVVQRQMPVLLDLLEEDFPDEVMETTDEMYADNMTQLREDQDKIQRLEKSGAEHKKGTDCATVHEGQTHEQWEKALATEINATKAHVKQQQFTNIVFANEAYVSQGAITHIVKGAQASKPETKAKVLAELKPAELLQSANEQLADFFKDMKHMEHVEKSADDATKKRRAAGEAFVHASKYLSRLLDAAVLLQEKYADDETATAQLSTPMFDLLERSRKATVKDLKTAVDNMLLKLRKSSTIPGDAKAEVAFDEVGTLFGVSSVVQLRKLITGFGVDFNERVRQLAEFRKAQEVDRATEREYFSAPGRR